jgi:hypothetical protein
MFLHRRELHVLNKCGRTLSTRVAFTEAVIRSVELIVQPGAHDGVGEMGVRGDWPRGLKSPLCEGRLSL